MGKRTYKAQDQIQSIHSDHSLQKDKPVAVYYRQSTDSQVGNVSTSIQTVDMVEYLRKQGWDEDKIILIDMDAGVSGTTKIDERPGMSLLFDLITNREIGAVACVDEDRLFRDITQIQVNIFIEACREANVQVITPFMVYDFVSNYTFHARQFRFKSEMAADYINTVILGKLNRAKRRLMMEGRWTGCIVVPSYMVDMRKNLPDGSINPDWKRYVPFPEYAEVVRDYFRIFIENAGNVHKTVKQIHKHGSYYPDPHVCLPPEGFKFVTRMKKYGGGYCPARNGLVNLLTNATLLGHWSVKGVIVRWNNHEPVIDEKTFYKAFNYLSDTTLDGRPNKNYQPYAKQARPSLEKDRPKERPLFAGMIVSKCDGLWKTVGTVWNKRRQYYVYKLQAPHQKEKIYWRRTADFVDDAIVELLQNKLTATFASDVWQETVANADKEYELERQRLQNQLATLEKVMENHLLSLDTINNVDLIRGIQSRYEEAQKEQKRLSEELAITATEVERTRMLEELKEMCEPTLEGWDSLKYEEKRLIVHAFIDRVEANVQNENDFKIHVVWVDGTDDTVILPVMMQNGWRTWTHGETIKLFELLDNKASQIDIASTFPERTWKSISDKIANHRGAGASWVSPRPIYSYESYEDYLKRTKDESQSYKASTADRWSPDDEQLLLCMLDNNATCLDMLQFFSHRRWMSIVKKLRRLRGEEVDIPQDERVRHTDMYRDVVDKYHLEIEEDTDRDEQVSSTVR